MQEYKLIAEPMTPSRSFFGFGGNLGTQGFMDIVNEHLAQGWTCQGGVAVLTAGDAKGTQAVLLMQALIR